MAAAPEAVWEVVSDPRRLARWWPRTERVKGITAKGWTTVLRSERGRAVRADWRLEQSERRCAGRGPRSSTARRSRGCCASAAWRRGSSALDGGTQVRLELRQRRAGGQARAAQMRRAAGRELDGALDGLEDVLR